MRRWGPWIGDPGWTTEENDGHHLLARNPLPNALNMEHLKMEPGTGERLLRFVGDRVLFALKPTTGRPPTTGWRGFLRTNLGRAAELRRTILHAHTGRLGLATGPWRDIPMEWRNDRWEIELTLTEVGFFKAKAYAMDTKGWQAWPEGANAGVSVHPDDCRSANTIYCAFPRMFGPTRDMHQTLDAAEESHLKALEKRGYAVLPPSGTFRQLATHLPHIVDTLGCRILHLLPVHPTPTTYARFGRYGSPYACLDLLMVDPALVEFDKRTTGVEQFKELTYACHVRGARVFMDVVINHTGWGSRLQELHPEWFVRGPDGAFVSPGAWGVTWEDLAELHHGNPKLWEHIAEVFTEWCRRGVDGFRCDAGYMIPMPAWRYIIARVQEEFPESVFLLEGLGGSWEATENLLTEGGMQWAYSELFQNHTGSAVAGYLDYALRQSERVGLFVHYSETHDNERLAKKGRAWSLLRNRLCALTSVSGGFGFTCGVEWLATEKIEVHQSRGMSWNNQDNIVPEMSRLNHLLCHHPCFFDQARLERLSGSVDPVLALARSSADGREHVLVLVNTDIEASHALELAPAEFERFGSPTHDLLGDGEKVPQVVAESGIRFRLKPGEAWCLSRRSSLDAYDGEAYRLERARVARALSAISAVLPCESIGPCDGKELAALLASSPDRFLGSLRLVDPERARADLTGAIRHAIDQDGYSGVVSWHETDARRVSQVPPDHWLLLKHASPFRATVSKESLQRHVRSLPMPQGHVAWLAPAELEPGNWTLHLEAYAESSRPVSGALRVLRREPKLESIRPADDYQTDSLDASVRSGMVLLTNGRGAMTRMAVDLGQVRSKYDCVLGANLHPTLPVDRHILVKRLRVWVNADGFITPLTGANLASFIAGPPARWRFVASAGDGRAVEIEIEAELLPEKNTVLFRFHRPDTLPALGHALPLKSHVSLTARFDILDRNFHQDTHFNPGTEHHFTEHTRILSEKQGFEFHPVADRRLRIWTQPGRYHPQPEWSTAVAHPVDGSRGQVDHEDAFSPGWFELALEPGEGVRMTVTAEGEPEPEAGTFRVIRESMMAEAEARAGLPEDDAFGRTLARAIQAFIVRREDKKTVIAGYPWFLDWGRDSLICARGLVAAGLHEEVRQLLMTFGRFVENGTLPNCIHGADITNRETSDAPLWYGLVTEELAEVEGRGFYQTRVASGDRTLEEVLFDIGRGYRDGTPNGIRMDRESGLIWSPSHFTWMDTNHPAGTPREGYPVEIQALWIRLCRQLGRLEGVGTWDGLAAQAMESLNSNYWREDREYPTDLLIAGRGQPASRAVPDTAFRSNCLLLSSLGLLETSKARRMVKAAQRHLVVPGALRSLAPLPVTPPLPIHGSDGQLLNHPDEPYCGRYEGDEDTRRKPAYHNGTAWTWTFPSFCEAMAEAWGFEPAAVAAARSWLGAMDELLTSGCLGQVPEIVDGDAPHTQRGCDAQAWGVTEALRVWKRLNAGVNTSP